MTGSEFVEAVHNRLKEFQIEFDHDDLRSIEVQYLGADSQDEPDVVAIVHVYRDAGQVRIAEIDHLARAALRAVATVKRSTITNITGGHVITIGVGRWLTR